MCIVRHTGVDEMQERMEGRRGNTRTIESEYAEERAVVVDSSLSGNSDGVAVGRIVNRI
jgi:hypothetical protein